MTRSLSSLIKGYTTRETEPFIIDANKSEIAQKVDRELKEACLADPGAFDTSDDPEFSKGLDAGQITEDEMSQVLNQGDQDEDSDPEEIIENARAKAQEIIDQAKTEAESIKNTAYDEARKAGFEDGRSQAEREYQTKKAQLESQMEEKEQNLKNQEDAYVDSLAPKVKDIVLKLVEKMCGTALEDSGSVVLYLVNNALKDLDNCKSFVVSVSPEDFPYVNQHSEKIYGSSNPGIKLEIFEDQKLTSGQCRIETENGLVDASFDLQLGNLKKAVELLEV